MLYVNFILDTVGGRFPFPCELILKAHMCIYLHATNNDVYACDMIMFNPRRAKREHGIFFP